MREALGRDEAKAAVERDLAVDVDKGSLDVRDLLSAAVAP
jgi:hypothetical protein